MKDIVLNLIPELKGMNEDYIDAIVRRYKDFIKYSEIPKICYGFSNDSIIPTKLNKFFENIVLAVQDKYSFLFNLNSYQNASYLAYMMLQKYFRACILTESRVEDILYIDTKLLVEDYKRLMDYDKNELSLCPVHTLETLYENIEKAPLVIWDKFMMLDSNYDKDKIYDIICIRNRKGLANFYFSINGTSELSKAIGPNLSAEMHQYLDTGFDCGKNIIDVNHTKEVSLFKC